MRQRKSKEIALCGVLGALMVTVMLMGNILPMATFCAPAIAGVLLLPVMAELGSKPAWTLYAAVGLLCVLLLPDLEMTLTFVFVTGIYPLVKGMLDRLHFRPLRLLAKLACFNLALVVMYSLLRVIYPVALVGIDGEAAAMVVLLVVLGNVAFALYDLAVNAMTRLYVIRLRPTVRKFLR